MLFTVVQVKYSSIRRTIPIKWKKLTGIESGPWSLGKGACLSINRKHEKWMTKNRGRLSVTCTHITILLTAVEWNIQYMSELLKRIKRPKNRYNRWRISGKSINSHNVADQMLAGMQISCEEGLKWLCERCVWRDRFKRVSNQGTTLGHRAKQTKPCPTSIRSYLVYTQIHRPLTHACNLHRRFKNTGHNPHGLFC